MLLDAFPVVPRITIFLLCLPQ